MRLSVRFPALQISRQIPLITDSSLHVAICVPGQMELAFGDLVVTLHGAYTTHSVTINPTFRLSSTFLQDFPRFVALILG